MKLRGGKICQNINKTGLEKVTVDLPSYIKDFRSKKGLITLKRKLSANQLFCLLQYSKNWQNEKDLVDILVKNPLKGIPPFRPGLLGGKELAFPANPIYETVVVKPTKSWLSGALLNKIILIVLIMIFIATCYVIFTQDKMLKLADKTVRERDTVIKIKDTVISGKDTLIKTIRRKCVEKMVEGAKDNLALKKQIPKLEETVSITKNISAQKSAMLRDLSAKIKRICEQDTTMHPDCLDYQTSRQFEDMKQKVLRHQKESFQQEILDWKQNKYEKF